MNCFGAKQHSNKSNIPDKIARNLNQPHQQFVASATRSQSRSKSRESYSGFSGVVIKEAKTKGESMDNQMFQSSNSIPPDCQQDMLSLQAMMMHSADACVTSTANQSSNRPQQQMMTTDISKRQPSSMQGAPPQCNQQIQKIAAQSVEFDRNQRQQISKNVMQNLKRKVAVRDKEEQKQLSAQFGPQMMQKPAISQHHKKSLSTQIQPQHQQLTYQSQQHQQPPVPQNQQIVTRKQSKTIAGGANTTVATVNSSHQQTKKRSLANRNAVQAKQAVASLLQGQSFAHQSFDKANKLMTNSFTKNNTNCNWNNTDSFMVDPGAIASIRDKDTLQKLIKQSKERNTQVQINPQQQQQQAQTHHHQRTKSYQVNHHHQDTIMHAMTNPVNTQNLKSKDSKKTIKTTATKKSVSGVNQKVAVREIYKTYETNAGTKSLTLKSNRSSPRQTIVGADKLVKQSIQHTKQAPNKKLTTTKATNVVHKRAVSYDNNSFASKKQSQNNLIEKKRKSDACNVNGNGPTTKLNKSSIKFSQPVPVAQKQVNMTKMSPEYKLLIPVSQQKNQLTKNTMVSSQSAIDPQQQYQTNTNMVVPQHQKSGSSATNSINFHAAPQQAYSAFTSAVNSRRNSKETQNNQSNQASQSMMGGMLGQSKTWENNHQNQQWLIQQQNLSFQSQMQQQKQQQQPSSHIDQIYYQQSQINNQSQAQQQLKSSAKSLVTSKQNISQRTATSNNIVGKKASVVVANKDSKAATTIESAFVLFKQQNTIKGSKVRKHKRNLSDNGVQNKQGMSNKQSSSKQNSMQQSILSKMTKVKNSYIVGEDQTVPQNQYQQPQIQHQKGVLMQQQQVVNNTHKRVKSEVQMNSNPGQQIPQKRTSQKLQNGTTSKQGSGNPLKQYLTKNQTKQQKIQQQKPYNVVQEQQVISLSDEKNKANHEDKKLFFLNLNSEQRRAKNLSDHGMLEFNQLQQNNQQAMFIQQQQDQQIIAENIEHQNHLERQETNKMTSNMNMMGKVDDSTNTIKRSDAYNSIQNNQQVNSNQSNLETAQMNIIDNDHQFNQVRLRNTNSGTTDQMMNMIMHDNFTIDQNQDHHHQQIQNQKRSHTSHSNREEDNKTTHKTNPTKKTQQGYTQQTQSDMQTSMLMAPETTQRVETELLMEQQRLIHMIYSHFTQLRQPLTTTKEFYRVGKLLGKGAFGRVNLAIHKLCNQLVAVKSIPIAKLLEDQDTKNKTIQEVGILQRLHHKNLVGLYDTFQTEKHLVFVIELCAGGDLLTYVRRRRRLTEDVAKVIFRQICDALLYCHSKLVVHRDVKLDNILFDHKGDIKICDFGVSKQLSKPRETMREQCGTPTYMAPEIYEGKGYKGFGCDTWSLGVSLYAMLIGTLPFKSSNIDTLQQKVCSGQFNFDIDNNGGSISEEAKDLISQLLQVNPKKRITIEQALTHEWMVSGQSVQKKHVQIFTDFEENSIEKVLCYRKKIQQMQNNNNTLAKDLGVDLLSSGRNSPYLFTELDLDDSMDNLMSQSQQIGSDQNNSNCNLRHRQTKSVVLAPFNTTLTDFHNLANSEQTTNNQKPGSSIHNLDEHGIDRSLILPRKTIQFGPRVRAINRQYEHNNNQDLDNGIYNQVQFDNMNQVNKKVASQQNLKSDQVISEKPSKKEILKSPRNKKSDGRQAPMVSKITETNKNEEIIAPQQSESQQPQVFDFYGVNNEQSNSNNCSDGDDDYSEDEITNMQNDSAEKNKKVQLLHREILNQQPNNLSRGGVSADGSKLVSPNSKQNQQIDSILVARIENEFAYPQAYIEESLKNGLMNDATACYYLLQKQEDEEIVYLLTLKDEENE